MTRTHFTGDARTRFQKQAAAEYVAGDTIRSLATRYGYSYGGMHSLLRRAQVTFRPRGHARVVPKAAR
jgi:hypothetical protein